MGYKSPIFFVQVTKLTNHDYKQEQKQDTHIIMTLAHVLKYINTNTAIQ